MTLKECYESMGADYDLVMSRLSREELVKRFVLKFPDQSGFEKLIEAYDAKDYEQLFAAVHTLKGVSLNLSLTGLAQCASDLTEALRGKTSADIDADLSQKIDELVQTLNISYRTTMSAIDALRESEQA